MMNYYQAYVATYFKDMYGEPFNLSPNQQRIFRLIYEPSILRGAIKTTTQYGKSEVASMALVAVAVERREKILILAPSEKQSGIIMGKAIDHIFDHAFITGMVDFSTGNLERLKEEKSKKRITFKNGSEIMILTADARSVQRESKNLMGFGATIVLVDESCLIPDSMFSKILRMVGGVENGKIIQLGNPFENNHFGKAFTSKRYETVSVDWRVALKEGRITQEFLDEAREDMSELDWLVFYECEFPDGGAEDSLIPRAWIELAVDQRGVGGDRKQTGLDVARFGRDKTVYIFRVGGVVKKIDQTEKMDTMEVTGWVNGLLTRDLPDVHNTDAIGVGGGVHDRLDELKEEGEVEWTDTEIVPINVGESAVGYEGNIEAKERYFNLRAQVYWNLRTRFKPDKENHSDICIPNDPELKKQLAEIRYRYSSEKKIKIEPKDDMKKRLGVSPDKADAMSLAFWEENNQQPEMFIVSS